MKFSLSTMGLREKITIALVAFGVLPRPSRSSPSACCRWP